ncbi:MAG: hypothetical protein GXO76_10240 [Calditrichaeota bacterium]|nr:hypothetical protein [Calditrichota bacterium]
MKAFQAVDTGLVEKFIQMAEGAAATVEKIKATPENLKAALVRAMGENSSATLAEPTVLPPELFAPFKSLPDVISHPTEDQMAAIRVGITDAFVGVAGTGSLCVAIDERLGGSVSLYSREHIAVLDARLMVPRPRDLFSGEFFERSELPENFLFITGPSATADMGELVRGVHGPGRLHIVLLV